MARIRLKGKEIMVGRDARCRVSVTDPRISRHHATLRGAADGWRLLVLPNVTHDGLVKHNGVTVGPGTDVALHEGDRLVFGLSPEYGVELDNGVLVLQCSDATVKAGQRPWRAIFHPASLGRDVGGEAFEAVKGDLDSVPAQAVDLVVADPARPGAGAGLRRLRAERFFLTLAILGKTAPRPEIAPFPVMGDAHVWAAATDPHLPERLAEAVGLHTSRERAALPFLTAEVLYVDEQAGRVHAHDWVRGAPREINLSDLQQQILAAMACAQRRGGKSHGMRVAEIATWLAERRWARSEHTVGNELSARLPRALASVGLHPQLFAATGTREKLYYLSTAPSCLREIPGQKPAVTA